MSTTFEGVEKVGDVEETGTESHRVSSEQQHYPRRVGAAKLF